MRSAIIMGLEHLIDEITNEIIPGLVEGICGGVDLAGLVLGKIQNYFFPNTPLYYTGWEMFQKNMFYSFINHSPAFKASYINSKIIGLGMGTYTLIQTPHLLIVTFFGIVLSFGMNRLQTYVARFGREKPNQELTGTLHQSPYQALGVCERATREEIEQAFRTISKKHHPDRNPASNEYFKQVSAAYDELKRGF